MSTELHDAAVDYATRLKWPIFPVVPGAKNPLTAHGYLDATTDVGQVEAWWKKTPHANIAAPTGVIFDVIDVEARHLADFLEGWQGSSTSPSSYPSVRTPGGGLHIYVAVTGHRCQRLWFGDFKGRGGYVLLPPSRIKDSIYEGLK